MLYARWYETMIVTVDDIRGEIPTYTISATSNPTEAQVVSFIADIEAQVRGHVGGRWPTNAESPAWKYLRQVIIEGSVWKTLRAKFDAMSGQMAPESIKWAYDAYMKLLGGLGYVDFGSIEDMTSTPAARDFPALSPVGPHPPLGGADFGDWTEGIPGWSGTHGEIRRIVSPWDAGNRWEGR